MKKEIELDPDVSECTYTTASGGVAVDIIRLATTVRGKEALRKLIEDLERFSVS